jgi:predicted enzyme related to lactoylglutathione lyase
MHNSRLAGFIIDCHTTDLDDAAAFWSAALGLETQGADGPTYVRLDGRSRDMTIEVQQVGHPSRVHLDIESDDVEAEVARLERLGAKRVEKIRTWVVMEAPTGQRFCVVQAKKELAGSAGVRTWG